LYSLAAATGFLVSMSMASARRAAATRPMPLCFPDSGRPPGGEEPSISRRSPAQTPTSENRVKRPSPTPSAAITRVCPDRRDSAPRSGISTAARVPHRMRFFHQLNDRLDCDSNADQLLANQRDDAVRGGASSHGRFSANRLDSQHSMRTSLSARAKSVRGRCTVGSTVRTGL
jgi:hypothetical protein